MANIKKVAAPFPGAEDMSSRRSTTEYDVKQQRREKKKSAKTKKAEAKELGARAAVSSTEKK